MMRYRAFLAILLLRASVPLLADSADLEVSISAPPSVRSGENLPWAASVRNLGPDAARDVILTTDGQGLGKCGSDIAVQRLNPGETHTVNCTAIASAPPFDRRIDARVRSTTPDPVGVNNWASAVVTIITPPDLDVRTSADSFIDPALPFTIRVSYQNYAFTAAHGGTVTIEVSPEVSFTTYPDFCAASPARLVCSVGDVGARAPGGFEVAALAPEAGSAGTLQITATIEAFEADFNPASNRHTVEVRLFPTFYVTSTADAGPGSLRDAIESANSACPTGICKIAFRIDAPADARWVTIAPESPLPPVTVRNVRIDGSTQTRFFGDSNPEGPEIEISGSRLSDGDGLRIAAPCGMGVRGLAVSGFPGNGLFIDAPESCSREEMFSGGHSVYDCVIGADPTGRLARPNMRGIFVAQQHPRWGVSIIANVIGGNHRSGIFVVKGAYAIRGNIIGLTRDLRAPLGNGASGIYIGPEGHGTDIDNNYIGFNHDFGIAIDREATNVAINGNSIQANWQLGIDRGLDGPDALLPPSDNRLPIPEITSARYDAVESVTIIEGTYRRKGDSAIPRYRVALYANDAPDPSGVGEGQYFLGTSYVSNGGFVLRSSGDLRGKWVAATATEVRYIGAVKLVEGSGTDEGILTTTTEFGLAVKVEP